MATIVVLIFFFSFQFAYGEIRGNTVTTSPTIKNIPASRESSAFSIKQKEKAKVKTKNQERVASIVTERANLLNSRWQALAHRIDRLNERTNSLLLKLGASGTDTTTARMLLETANSKIKEARERSVLAYSKIISSAEESNGTASDLYRLEKNIINPEKEAVAKAFQSAKDSLDNVLKALPQNKK